MHKLEVIVMSAAEARMAEDGGADRLELVRDLDSGGLTPDAKTLDQVLATVKIPVRVMLRENATMRVASDDEMRLLQTQAREIQKLPIDGIVMGWLTEQCAVDVTAMTQILSEIGEHKVTFHRAFELVIDWAAGFRALKQFPRIDKILHCGGQGSWEQRKQRLHALCALGSPEIEILVGGGLSESEALELMGDSRFAEVHVGRAVRTPPENNGAIDPEKIRRLKRAAQ